MFIPNFSIDKTKTSAKVPGRRPDPLDIANFTSRTPTSYLAHEQHIHSPTKQEHLQWFISLARLSYKMKLRFEITHMTVLIWNLKKFISGHKLLRRLNAKIICAWPGGNSQVRNSEVWKLGKLVGNLRNCKDWNTTSNAHACLCRVDNEMAS